MRLVLGGTMTGSVRPRACGVFLFAAAIAAFSSGRAEAQFVCAQDGGGNGGATASGSAKNFACGTSVDASGVGSENTASGTLADAHGDNSRNFAAGYNAIAHSDTFGTPGATGGASNIAIGDGAQAWGFGSSATDRAANVAIGMHSTAGGLDSNNIAAGSGADAGGSYSNNIATGTGANANGFESANIASGQNANASGVDSRNVASGTGGDASGNFSANIASGSDANASGDGAENIAIGASADASGDSSRNVAIGWSSKAQNGGVAFGTDSSATHTNTAAFGQGATTVRANQQMFGNGANTYTMAGLNTAASRTAQGAPTHFVTTNMGGDLAAHTAADLGLATQSDITVINSDITTINNQLNNFNTQISQLGGQTELALAGVAMAFAMAGTPALGADENFALSVNLGHYEGHTATSLGAALRLTESVQITGSAAYSDTQDSLGGRVGMRFGW